MNVAHNYLGRFLILLGLVIVMHSVYGACCEHSSDYFFARLLENDVDSKTKKEVIGCFEDIKKIEDAKYNMDSIDNIDQDQFKLVGVYCISDEAPIYVYNNNTQANRNFYSVEAFLGAVFIVAGIICLLINKNSPMVSEVSMENFFVFVLCVPFLYMSIFSILSNLQICSIAMVFIVYGVAEIACLIIWFGYHLWRRRKDLSPEDFDKLDLYSTIAIVALTFVWVIYDISSFKLYFGIILVIFMVVQAKIKMIQIDKDSESKN